MLHLIPNTTIPNTTITLELSLLVPQLATLINVSGSTTAPATNITFEGLTFAHTRRTLLEAYVVPSAGDWSVHPSGALTASGAVDLTIQGCVFNHTGGNAVVLRGGVLRASVRWFQMPILT